MKTLTKGILLMAALAGASSVQATEFRYRFLMGDTVAYDWQTIDSIYDDWTDQGNYYNCQNWSPSTATVGKGIAFTQTATDCQQNQSRTVHPQQKDSRTGIVEAIPDSEYEETQTIYVTHTRDSVGILENWSDFDPTYTSWVDTNALYGCTSWSPDPSIYTASAQFTQSSNTCKTDQQRQRQDREKEQYTDEVRDNGAPVTESQTLTAQSASRPYTVALGTWTNTGSQYACTDWSPDPSTQGKGVAYTQNATDCKLDQVRTRAESYVDHKTGTTTNVPKANEARTLIKQANSRDAVGTREDWSQTTSTYTPWANTVGKVLYSCTNWTPAGSSKTASGVFSQTATDCQTDQTRTRQDREIEANTQEIRNKGAVVTESQTLSGQVATRNYTVAISSWANNGALNSCSNWSPDPSTVTVNQAFTQTATDCQQPQSRTRAESYVDHVSGSTVAVSNVTQTQSVTASSTRTATGTKETWVATTSAYSAWANSSAVYSCSNWSPAASTVTINQAFTQTATNCSVNQTRTRQDRQVETTTGAVRNNGAAVTESQVVGGQVGYQTAYGPKETWVATSSVYGAWYNTSGVYSCSAWTPDPSTVNAGTAYTQTGTGCYINQARSRQDRQVETTTGAIRNNGAAVTETQTVGGQVTYQTATGTKPTIQCLAYDGNNSFIQAAGGRDHDVLQTVLKWGGSEIYRNSGWQNSVATGGYTYTRGAVSTVSNVYGICRQ
jgi:hypothetical protein